MKTFVAVMALVAVASAHPAVLNPVAASPAAPAAAPTTAAAGATATSAAGLPAVGANGQINWGPKVYGPGLNNAWAIPANPLLIQRALNYANLLPNTLVFVDVDGEVDLTNQYGQEIDLVSPLGFEYEI